MAIFIQLLCQSAKNLTEKAYFPSKFQFARGFAEIADIGTHLF